MEEKSQDLTNQLSAQEKMVKGSIWLSAGNIVSRLLGAIYIIPWYAWLGENARNANSLFSMGYNVYALFLMISTAGIPQAIAKQIAHYNSLNEYKVSARLFKQSVLLMGIIGIISSVIMFLFSPVLAQGNPDLIPVMRSLSIGILIFPIMSAIRGFFQGNHNMVPTAISQVVEQVARVFYMLLATFIIMKVMKGQYTSAVVQSTFAAFIGMLGAFIVLGYYLWKEKARFSYLLANSEDNLNVSAWGLVIDIVKDAIPFIIIGSSITLLKLFDQYTFFHIMMRFTDYTQKELYDLFSIFAANPDKLTMVVIALATSLSTTSLPLISEAYTLRHYKNLAKLIEDNIDLFCFVMLPATLGMISLAYPLNTLFYEPSRFGSAVLVEASFIGIIIGFYMLASTLLQGFGYHKQAMFYLLLGFILKMLLQVPFIFFFETYGPLLSTGLGLFLSTYLTLREVHRLSRFDISHVIKRAGQIFILSMVMFSLALLSRGILGFILPTDKKVTALILTLLVAFIGGFSYIVMTLKVRLADKLLGNKVDRIRKKLRIF